MTIKVPSLPHLKKLVAYLWIAWDGDGDHPGHTKLDEEARSRWD